MASSESVSDSWLDDVAAAYREHYESLLGQARQVCGDPASAEDACQEVFVRLLMKPRSAESLRPPYLVVAVCNTCRDHRRRERMVQPLGPGTPEPATPPLPDHDEHDQSPLVTEWLASLSRDQHRTVIMRVDEQSYQEIASALGVRTATVQTHLDRARRKFWNLSGEREREREESRE